MKHDALHALCAADWPDLVSCVEAALHVAALQQGVMVIKCKRRLKQLLPAEVKRTHFRQGHRLRPNAHCSTGQ